MFYPRKFIDKTEENRIIESIRSAELNTSGEICVHFQKKLRGPVMEEALKTFRTMKLDQTEKKNGVLFFISPAVKQFAILGDKGINDVVADNFWDEIIEDLRQHFRAEKIVDGLCKNIELVGLKLKEHFPYQHDDVNELSDEISYS